MEANLHTKEPEQLVLHQERELRQRMSRSDLARLLARPLASLKHQNGRSLGLGYHLTLLSFIGLRDISS